MSYSLKYVFIVYIEVMSYLLGFYSKYLTACSTVINNGKDQQKTLS